MSDHQDQSSLGWNVDTLQACLLAEINSLRALMESKEKLYDQRFSAQEEALRMALMSSDKALTKSEGSTEARFASVNELRKTLTDQTGSFLPRAVYEASHKSLVDRIDVLSARMDRREGSGTGAASLWGYVVGAVGLLIALATAAYAILKH